VTSTGPFALPVGHLRRTHSARLHRICRGVLPDLAVTGSAVPEGEPVEAEVDLEPVQGGIAVAGTVRFAWVGSCRRCLAPTGGTFEVAVVETFTPGGDGEETYPLVGDVVDLEPMVRDAVVLQLPPAPLCMPACLGLCPSCGTDRNRRSCHCAPVGDGRWAALDALLPAPSDQGASSGYRFPGPATR